MARLIAICLFIALILFCFTGQQNVYSQDQAKTDNATTTGPIDPKELETWIDGFLAGFSDQKEALSLAIVIVKDNKILFQKGYGYADYEGHKRVLPDETIFRTASVSKLVTATAVMQLVERGKINLDADVNSYLKRFQIVNPYPTPVTVRHLLTHTSGIDERLIGNSVATPQELISLGDYFARRQPRVTRLPGKQIIYSNLGMSLAGYLVEVVSGVSFEEYVEQNIFKPLGMAHSSFRQPYPADLAQHVVPSGADEGAILLAPASSMISTVTDMSHFLMAHLNGGSYAGAQLLSEASVREMHRQQFSAHPKIPGVGLGFFEYYSNGKHGLFHTGRSGHQSELFLLPEEKLGFYIVHSSREGGEYEELRQRFTRAFIEHYYPAAPTPASASLADNSRSIKLVTGIYRPNLFPRQRFENIGNLGADTFVTANDDNTLTLRYPPYGLIKILRLVEREPLLFESDEQIYVAFRQDQNGAVTQMFISGALSDPLTFDKLRWFESGTLHATLAAIGGLICFSFCLIVFGGNLLRVVPRIRKRLPSSFVEFRLAWFWAGMVCLLTLLSPISFMGWYFLSEPSLLPYGLESAIRFSLSLLQVAALLGLLVPIFAFVVWKKRCWTLTWRLGYSLVALTCFLMIPFLYYWSLLSLRFF